MSTQIILKVLALRRRLRQRDCWTRLQLEEHQDRALHRLREHAYVRSLFYRRSHKGFTDRPLGDLPILTKEMVMEHFDELVTDPTVRLTDVEAHLATLSAGDELFGGRYRVDSTSGSTGRRGLFLWDLASGASVLASYNRSFDWAGVRAGLTHRTRMAVVSSITPWHQSARVGASVSSLWVSTPPGLGYTASTGEVQRRALQPKVVNSFGKRRTTAMADALLVPVHDGGRRMDSARRMGFVMRSRTIQPLPWEATGCAKC
jgi:phenylacetate-CoA ligase